MLDSAMVVMQTNVMCIIGLCNGWRLFSGRCAVALFFILLCFYYVNDYFVADTSTICSQSFTLLSMHYHIKLAAIIAFSFAGTQAVGQPVLKDIERFTAGHQMTYLKLMQPLPGGTGGAAQTWDFSGLKTTGADTVRKKIIAAAGVPEAAKFVKANIIEQESDGSMVITEQSDKEALVWGTIRKGYNTSNSIPYVFMKRPLAYMDSVVSHPVRTNEVMGNEMHGAGTSKTIADGWGKLLLPSGTYQVLRVRFEQQFKDTAANGAVTTTSVVSYCWFDAAHKGALLKTDEVTVASPYYNNTFKQTMCLLEEKD